MAIKIEPYVPVQNNTRTTEARWYCWGLTSEEMIDISNNKFHLVIDLPPGSYLWKMGGYILTPTTGASSGEAIWLRFYDDAFVQYLIDNPLADVPTTATAYINLSDAYGTEAGISPDLDFVTDGFKVWTTFSGWASTVLLRLAPNAEVTMVCGVIPPTIRGAEGVR